MTVAAIVEPLVRATVGDQLPVGLCYWDGSRTGPATAPLWVNIRRRRALRRLLWSPSELGFARAYVSGDVDIEGNLLAGLTALEEAALGQRARLDAATIIAAIRSSLRLGVIGPPPKPPAEEANLTGPRHTKRRDAAAIAHHYDVGNDFYRLLLGESMIYSCAYWRQMPGPTFGLADAQFAKCDLVARKLGLAPGTRLLDVGCGWGSFALHAARVYGAHVVGVTLSREQARYARQRVDQEGLGNRIEIRFQDYRDVDDGPYQAISSIGMAEHVGAAMLPVYAARLFTLLGSGGRLLNQAISRRPGSRTQTSTTFIDRYVFPDGELQSLTTMVGAIEGAGFEIRDVESLREHYGLTLRAWIANLESHWNEAVAATSLARTRIWGLYLAGSASAFESNRIGINQILAVRPRERGASGMPLVRPALNPVS